MAGHGGALVLRTLVPSSYWKTSSHVQPPRPPFAGAETNPERRNHLLRVTQQLQQQGPSPPPAPASPPTGRVYFLGAHPALTSPMVLTIPVFFRTGQGAPVSAEIQQLLPQRRGGGHFLKEQERKEGGEASVEGGLLPPHDQGRRMEGNAQRERQVLA